MDRFGRRLMNIAPNNVEQCWLSYAQLAERLGVCERTIRRDVDEGKLPKPIRIRGCVRFDWLEVEAALKQRQQI
jgi:excisionase family DNA binding protein